MMMRFDEGNNRFNYNAVDHFFAKILTPLSLPFLLAQGVWVRLRTPRLPSASGPCSGIIGAADDAFELIVLGESPVAGIGARTHEAAITGQTATALACRIHRSIRWQALGLSGATADRALRELVPRIACDRADAVIIALGVNDVIQWHGVSRWSRNLEELISAVRRQVGDSLIVLTGVPPMQYFPALPRPLRSVLGGRAMLLDQASILIAEASPGIIHVHSRFELSKEFFCEDGFHPSEWGYAEWGKRLAEAIASAREQTYQPGV
jgi:lysophospholipase L1-like esterase